MIHILNVRQFDFSVLESSRAHDPCDQSNNCRCSFCTALNCPLCENPMSMEGFNEDGIYVAYCNNDECKLFTFQLPLDVIGDICRKT